MDGPAVGQVCAGRYHGPEGAGGPPCCGGVAARMGGELTVIMDDDFSNGCSARVGGARAWGRAYRLPDVEAAKRRSR